MSDPTSYPEVNTVLQRLLAATQTTLGEQFVALYLYGSLASGDFDPERSDLDFAVVTEANLPTATVAALEDLHTRLWASGLKWAAKLEGAYVPRATLRRHAPTAAPCPTLNEGQFYLAQLGSDWVIQRHILREHGVMVAGPPPDTLIDPVSPDDLRGAVRGILQEWWAPTLTQPARLQTSEYQAYAVLTMCRALHALQSGAIVSKPVAARWVQAAVSETRAALIEWALAWTPSDHSDHLAPTLDFVRYTLDNA